jgi:hypothetical protein
MAIRPSLVGAGWWSAWLSVFEPGMPQRCAVGVDPGRWDDFYHAVGGYPGFPFAAV